MGRVDECVTRAFIDQLGSPLLAQSRVIHVENSPAYSHHAIRTGRIIHSRPEDYYSEESISRADVGVIVSGAQASKRTMDVLIQKHRRVVPLAWLGNDGFELLQDLLRGDDTIGRNHRRRLLSLVDPTCASDTTVSRVLGSALHKDHAIFISYHRTDCAADAGRLASHLSAQYGSERLFVDYSSLPVGARLDVFMDKAAACRVFILLIGPSFASRTADERDWVRQEILAAHAGGGALIALTIDVEFADLLPLCAPLAFLGQHLIARMRRDSGDDTLRVVEKGVDAALGITRMRAAID